MNRMQIIGLEASSGTSSKSGKVYDIGSVHTTIAMGAPLEGNIAAGRSGTTYRCTSAIIKSIAHNPLPFFAEVESEDVMQFGQKVAQISSIKPVADIKK